MRVGLGTVILAIGLVGFLSWLLGPVSGFFKYLEGLIPFVGAPGPASAPAYYLYQLVKWTLTVLGDPRAWSLLIGLGAVAAMLERR